MSLKKRISCGILSAVMLTAVFGGSIISAQNELNDNIIMTKKSILGISVLDDEQFSASDVNNDGKVDIFDCIHIKSGLIDSDTDINDGYAGFIRADGKLLVDENDKQYIIKGIAFGNNVWANPSQPPENKHHTEESYKELAELGFNSVRFYLNYKLFEDDSNPYSYNEAGFEWIDENIRLAEKYGIRLILNMHYPQGGYQSQGNGQALWTDEENQKRLSALWREIAKRYADEPAVLGYGLINEPIVAVDDISESLDKLQSVMQNITDSIRTVDTNHIIFAERLLAAQDSATNAKYWETYNDDSNFVIIDDDNVAYEFHFYDPHPYTHQQLNWAGTGTASVKYPDEDYCMPTNPSWYTSTLKGTPADTSSDEWQYLESNQITITDDNQVISFVFQAENLGNSGIAYMDDVEINEYDENGNFVRKVYSNNFDSDVSANFWSSDNSGRGYYSIFYGHDNKGCLLIQGTSSDANMGINYFRAKKGYSYSASGYAKVENADENAIIRPRTDVWKCSSVEVLDKQYLYKQMLPYIEFSEKYNVPLYCGEFGTNYKTFSLDLGGSEWVSDMIDIFMENGIGFDYHDYHEGDFGLYIDAALTPPTTLNEELYDVFRQKLGGQD